MATRADSRMDKTVSPTPRYGSSMTTGAKKQNYAGKGDNNMYPFNELGFTLAEVDNRNEGILQNLSLFAPYNHEDDLLLHDKDTSAPGSAQGSDVPTKELRLERPVTPIDDEIKAPPSTFQRLAKLVRRRIVPKPGVSYLGQDDQKELAAIIMGEVNGIWANIKMQVQDPFLTAAENAELQRRITVHVVTVCEQLFVHYLHKAQILNKRGVFSGPANMSRLKAQLGLDANKFLNILTIRRYIVSDLKCQRDKENQTTSSPTKETLPQQQFPLLSYKGLIEASRPKSKAQKQPFGNTEENILQMQENMPDLDTSKLMSLLYDLPTDRTHSRLTDAPRSMGKAASQGATTKRRTSEDISRDKLLIRKSDSVPLLSYGESLMEELGIGQRPDSARSLCDIDEDGETTDPQKHGGTEPEVKLSKPVRGTWEYQQEDLRRLASRGLDKDTPQGQDKKQDKQDSDESDDDLPPLLQAGVNSDKQEGRRQEIEQQLQRLELIEKQRLAEERIEIQEPTHPQPATKTTKLPNKMLVRTSDVRVSDRVCLSSITLDKHNTVYNDLVDEIDPVIVKQLDSNLSLGDEITEVYTEIMKTVPTDHLILDNDAIIEPAAGSLNLSNALASSTLHKRGAERIVNPSLRQTDQPPWGNQDVTDWAKTPFNPPTDLKGRPLVNPMIPKGEGLTMGDFYGEGVDPPPAPPPGMGGPVPALAGGGGGGGMEEMPEVMARSYASWLQWWKNTINSDDYMKYLSTQESDYMAAIFHFYNSDDEDDDADYPSAPSRATRKSRQAAQEARERKLEELKEEKTGFTDGFWNANAVLMGGLGRDPTLDEEDTELSSKTPVADEAPSLGATRNRSILVSRKSQQKSQPVSDNMGRGAGTREGAVSGPTRSMGDTRGGAIGNQGDTRGGAIGNQRVAEGTESGLLTPQERLEKVWASLQMPDHLKLDMAIKYSSDKYHGKLGEAIESWEEATELVLQRESLIAKLEDFERLASDPNRFFEKGQRGSSVARLEEARMRSLYYKKIESTQEQLLVLLGHLYREYQDKLTYQGRPYLDKMHWDRTEMLYWLQEERKSQAIDYESRIQGAGGVSAMAIKLAHIDQPTPTISV